MKPYARLVLFSWLWMAGPSGALAQVPEIGESAAHPTPEIQHLFAAFGGDWDTRETRARTQFFPDGGERRGKSKVRLAAGGAMLVMDGHSDGSAGPLSYHIVIWWDENARLYGYFTCFKDTRSGCQTRGTARWKANTFVNDYEEDVDGKRLKFRDTYEDITPNSYTLNFVWVKEDGSTEPVIVSQALRRGSPSSRAR